MQLPPPKILKTPSFWLAGIGISLSAVQLSVLWRTEQLNLLGLSALFWLAVGSRLWEKRHSFVFESGIFPSFFGVTLISLLLLKSLFLTSGFFASLFPLVSAFGLGLMASGWRGLKQYWQELLLLLLLGLSQVSQHLLLDIDPSMLTAKFATYILWYAGFEVTRQGNFIILSTGAIQVNSGCSGLGSITHMFSLAVLFLMCFPLKRYQKLIVPPVAIFLGFATNGIRVALMAVLVALGKEEAFSYWHGEEGSFVFSVIAVLFFFLFCLFLLQEQKPILDENEEVA